MGFLNNIFKKSTKKELTLDVKDKLRFLEVDMHNHLLPGIDDGSTSVEQSLDYIADLHTLGFRKLICTPHIMAGVHNNSLSTIAAAQRSLQEGLTATGSPMLLDAAAEHMIDDGLFDLIQGNQLAVMPGGYVLIEMSYLSASHALFQTIADIQKMGLKPVLAHPERYPYYHHNFDMYKQIKDAGCLLQLNLLSLSRYYGTEVKVHALTMVTSGMYDFVGTDLHHDRHLAALKDIADKYPLQDMLKPCSLLNESLLG